MAGDPAISATLPVPGERVAGKYRIERIVGRGGMGVVYAAHHIVLDQRVALKILAPEVASQNTAVTRFLTEARLAARLKSERLCQVIDAGVTENGLPYIAMELLEGCDLARLLYERRGPLPVGEAVEYVVQALDAVAEAHARGVVHRDLKPSNLFLTQHTGAPPVIKVLDFGISKVDEAFGTGGSLPTNVTASRAIIGSPTYMSPEQIQNVKKTDHRADIWSVGIILYELMSNTLPFRGDTAGEIFVQIIEGKLTPLSKIRPEVPVALSDIVARCLTRNPDERFDSVVSLAEALAPYAWYKHHNTLTRMRRAVGTRHGAMTPGTTSASVPAAVKTGSSTQIGMRDRDGGTGRKVLLGLAALVPLVLIPLAGIFVVQRIGHKPAEATHATAEPLPAAAPDTAAVATVTAMATAAAPAVTTTAAETATAPAAATATEAPTAPASTQAVAPPPEPPPSAAPAPTPEPPTPAPQPTTPTISADQLPVAPATETTQTPPTPQATQPVRVPPKKRSILQQRY
jgi:serine/threonine-protein kinase